MPPTRASEPGTHPRDPDVDIDMKDDSVGSNESDTEMEGASEEETDSEASDGEEEMADASEDEEEESDAESDAEGDASSDEDESAMDGEDKFFRQYKDEPQGLEHIDRYPALALAEFDGYRESLDELVDKIPGWSKHIHAQKILGFNLKELRKTGALGLHVGHKLHDIRSTLDNPILPVFAEDNWHNGTDVISGFWRDLVDGRRKWNVDSYGRPTSGIEYKRIRQSVPWSIGTEQRVHATLDRLAELVSFKFLNENDAFGTTHYPGDSPDGDISGISITFAKTYLKVAQYIAKLRRTSRKTACAILRFQFCFALVIVHEIAHAFEIVHGLREADRPRWEYEREARYFDDDWSEAGFCWELSVFGGAVTGINSFGDGFWGVSMEAHEGGEPLRGPARLSQRHYAVPCEYIWDLQQRDFWLQRSRSRYDLNINWYRSEFPKQVAKGYYFNVIPSLFAAQEEARKEAQTRRRSVPRVHE